jgi:hypothetical protein
LVAATTWRRPCASNGFVTQPLNLVDQVIDAIVQRFVVFDYAQAGPTWSHVLEAPSLCRLA